MQEHCSAEKTVPPIAIRYLPFAVFPTCRFANITICRKNGRRSFKRITAVMTSTDATFIFRPKLFLPLAQLIGNFPLEATTKVDNS